MCPQESKIQDFRLKIKDNLNKQIKSKVVLLCVRERDAQKHTCPLRWSDKNIGLGVWKYWSLL